MTHWMIVSSADNYECTRALKFSLQGVKSRHRRKAERMAPGDRVCWYLTKIQGFVATATLTSPAFEGAEAIWKSEKTADRYPWRFRITKDYALDPDRAIPATALLGGLAFVKKWPAAHWRLAFQGNLHELGGADFALVERAIEAAASASGAAGR